MTGAAIPPILPSIVLPFPSSGLLSKNFLLKSTGCKLTLNFLEIVPITCDATGDDDVNIKNFSTLNKSTVLITSYFLKYLYLIIRKTIIPTKTVHSKLQTMFP